MARLTDLPNELLLQVGHFSGTWRDLVALSGADRRCHKLIGDLVLRKMTQMGLSTVYLFWIIDAQLAGAVRRALQCGIDPTKMVEPRLWPAATRSLLGDDPQHPANPSPPVLSYRRAAGHIVRNSGLLLYEMETCIREPKDVEMPEPLRLREYRQRHQSKASSALHLAAQGGDIEIIANLLRHGANLDAMYLDPQGGPIMAPRTNLSGDQQHTELRGNFTRRVRPRVQYTPLHCAIFSSNAQAAKHLIEAGASLRSCIPVDDPTQSAWMVPSTPLHLASFMGSVDVVEYLVENGYQKDVNEKDYSGISPLVYAAVGGNLRSTGRYLLQKGADPNAHVSPYYNLVLQSCWCGHFEDALILLDHGATVEPQDPTDMNMSPLHACCVRTTNPWRVKCYPTHVLAQFPAQEEPRLQVIERLLHLGIGANRRSNVPLFGTATPLLLAADSCFAEVAALLVRSGGDVEARSDTGDTALLLALLSPSDEKSKFDTVSYLLDRGCDVNERNARGESALHVLGSLGRSVGQRPLDPHHAEVLVRRMIDLGADIRAHTTQGTPVSVFQAFFKLGSYTLCKLLADCGAATSIKPGELLTIFKQFVQERPKAYLDMDANSLLELLLLVDNADIILNDPENLEYALVNGDMETAQFLIERGCPLGKECESGTALHRACRIGAFEVVALLLNRKQDVNAPFNGRIDEGTTGWTPIEFAMDYARRGHHGIQPDQDRKQKLFQVLLEHNALIRNTLISRVLIHDLILHNQAELLDMVLSDDRSSAAHIEDMEPLRHLEFIALACDSTERLCSPAVIRVLLRHILPLTRPPLAAAPDSDSDAEGSRWHDDFSARFRSHYRRGPLEMLVMQYRPLEACPYEDCHCGANLVRSILAVVRALDAHARGTHTEEEGHHHQHHAGGVDSQEEDEEEDDDDDNYDAPAARALLMSSTWRPRLAAIFQAATLQMGSHVVAGTSPGGTGRSTRHCLEFVMDRLNLSSADLRRVLTRSSYLGEDSCAHRRGAGGSGCIGPRFFFPF